MPMFLIQLIVDNSNSSIINTIFLFCSIDNTNLLKTLIRRYLKTIYSEILLLYFGETDYLATQVENFD